MALGKNLKAAAGNAGGAATYVDDVFSVDLYKGNGNPHTVTNGIDLLGEGGAVFQHDRFATNSAGSVYAFSTYAPNDTLKTDTTDDYFHISLPPYIDFYNDGFRFNSNGTGSGSSYVTWTFRKATGFFDVVTWTGDGSGLPRTISHNLGTTVGSIFVKATNLTGDNWKVYHRALGNDGELRLNTTDAVTYSSSMWNNTTPTSTSFQVPSVYNVSGRSYIAYLFAHNNNDGEFGKNADQDIIKCGSYTGNGSASGPVIDLGFEPQFLIIKNASASATNWSLNDSMRGLTVTGSNDTEVFLNVAQAEGFGNDLNITSTGFQPTTSNARLNGSGNQIIYIAIRRPHKPAKTGSEVFESVWGVASGTPVFPSSFTVDATILHNPPSVSVHNIGARLTGDVQMYTDTDGTETAQTGWGWDQQTGVWDGGNLTNYVAHMFKRSPGFFDVVAYTGNGIVGRTVNHNLGVAPEMMWVKKRNGTTRAWSVYHVSQTASKHCFLNDSNEFYAHPAYNSTEPTSSLFTVSDNDYTNTSGADYIAYLFASQPGISKVGSYAGNGTSQTIDCGFTTGARLVLIKRADITGDWHVWDSTRGIVAGNDPYLELNTTNVEVTTADSIDPDSSGFIVNQEASAGINSGTGTYIYLAIA